MSNSKKNKRQVSDLKDVVIIFSVIIIILVSASLLNFFEKLRNIAANPEGFRIVELLFVLALFGIAYAVFSRRRWREAKEEIELRFKDIEVLQDNINRLKSTVDLSPDAIVVISKEGNLIFVNQAGVDLLRAENEEDITGRHVTDFVHFSFKEKILNRIEEMSKYMKRVPPLDMVLKRVDGTYLDVSVASTPVSYHAIPHIITIIRDISERKKTEELKSQLASIVLNSYDAIYAMDLDGSIQRWNPGAERLYGFSAKEALGSNIGIIYPGDLKQEAAFLLGKISKGEKIDSFETKRFRKDKSIIDVSITVSPIIEDSGIITGASTIARDITFKKKVEEELRLYAEELALSNEELYVFSYAASHDLQEPLKTVQFLIELLNKKYKNKLDSETAEYLKSSDDGVVRMYRLITDFLMYSRVGSERAIMEVVDCNAVLKDAIANLEVAIKDSKAKIKQFTLPEIWGNSLQMTQIFQNLIGNAIKYQGEDTPQIVLSAEKKGDMWQFAVKDNGIGIEQWFSERIFIVFQKLHDHKKYPGSGIGLALCKRVIEKHGGKIWFESEVGKGTTFFFTLPVYTKKKKK
jgi:PAS domain S-box-containing protein